MTVVDLVKYLQSYVVPYNYYNDASYNAAQPSEDQRRDWRSAVQALLAVSSEEACTTEHIVPEGIRDFYSAATFRDKNLGQSYCLLYEHAAQNGTFTKGWGFMMTRISNSLDVFNSLHLSAPHPGYDLYTPEQAAYVFSHVGAKSLLVAGRSRRAYVDSASPSIYGKLHDSGRHITYYATDPTHNNVSQS
jgi:hypothetical protein